MTILPDTTEKLSQPRLAILDTPTPWALRFKVLEDYPAEPPYMLRAGQVVVMVALDAAAPAGSDEPMLTDATEGERHILSEMKAWPGMVFDFTKCLRYIRKLEVEFPSLNLLEVARELSVWLESKPKEKGSLLRFRRFCVNAKDWKQAGKADHVDDEDDPLAWTRSTG